MTNGNIGTDTAAVLALLADTNRAGRGYGYWGGEGGYGGAFGPYASVSSLQHTVDRNGVSDLIRDCRNTVQEQSADIRDAFASAQLKNAVEQLGGGQARMEGRIADTLAQHQLNTLREQADISRQIAACCCETQKALLQQSLESQKCCCETQKLVFQENQSTRDVIMQNELRRATDANNVSATVGAINAAAAQNTAAIIAAIQGLNNHHHGH